MRAAFLAAALRLALPRFLALARACRERACGDAALLPSRFKASSVARDRFGLGFRLVAFVAFLPGGGCNLTPALRAFESPMAMACLADRAPCFPSRTWSISSRTYSPACVEGALPSALSFCARRVVSLSGMAKSCCPRVTFEFRFPPNTAWRRNSHTPRIAKLHWPCPASCSCQNREHSRASSCRRRG